MLADKLRAAKVLGGIKYVGGRTEGFAGSASNITVSLTGLSGGTSSSPNNGDLVMVYFGVGTTFAQTLSVDGYTSVAQVESGGAREAVLRVAYKFMSATPDTSITLTNGTRGDQFAGAVSVHVWKNVGSVTSSATASATGSVLCNPPSVTPTVAGSIILAGGAGVHTEGIATFSSSDLSNFLSSGGNDNYDVSIGLGSKEWQSGSFNPAAFSFSASDSPDWAWSALTLILTP
jgi:hypothetical protein